MRRRRRFYIVTYALAIYNLNLLLGFIRCVCVCVWGGGGI